MTAPSPAPVGSGPRVPLRITLVALLVVLVAVGLAATGAAATSLLKTLLDRRTQAEHALQRLDDGTYGNCEGCAKPIPVERLEVFPSATTCVNCKQVRERRAS